MASQYPGPITPPDDQQSPPAYDLSSIGNRFSDPTAYFLAPQPINNTSLNQNAEYHPTNAEANLTDVTGSAITPGSGGYASALNTRKPGQMQSTLYDKPTNYPSPEQQKAYGYGGAAQAGLGASSNIYPTQNATDSAIQVGGATLQGAAQGAMVGAMAGGPGALVGGAVGGLVGLVNGGLNAWVGNSAARAAQRKQDKINQQILARQDARYQQERADTQKYFDISRGDNLEQIRFNRKQAALNTTWDAQKQAIQALNDAMKNNVDFRKYLASTVR